MPTWLERIGLLLERHEPGELAASELAEMFTQSTYPAEEACDPVAKALVGFHRDIGLRVRAIDWERLYRLLEARLGPVAESTSEADGSIGMLQDDEPEDDSEEPI